MLFFKRIDKLKKVKKDRSKNHAEKQYHNGCVCDRGHARCLGTREKRNSAYATGKNKN